jgi:hypothetical protein
MQVKEFVSLRIAFLRFPLIIGVVFIHNIYTVVYTTQGTIGVEQNRGWVKFIIFFLSQGVARTAVPLFFIFSGYLFCSGSRTWESYTGKLKKRIHSLLIPFVFWGLLTSAIYAAEQNIPCLHIYFPETHIYFSPLLSYLNALFGITAQFPIAYQFWFIRDLMALVVLAPIIHFVVARKSALPFLLILFCMWFASLWPIIWPGADAAFFFSLGIYLSLPEKNVACLDRFGPWICSIFLCLLVLESSFQDTLRHLHKFVIIFGIPSVWWIVGQAVRVPAIKSFFLKLSGASFFVFAAHQPLLTIARAALYKLFMPSSGITVIALYFLIPILLIVFLVVVHHYLQKIVPSFAGVIAGSSFRLNKYQK